MNHLSVIEALLRIDSVLGLDISIEGTLSFEFENVALWQSIETLNKHDYRASIWLEVGTGAYAFNESVCAALHRKRVIVTGSMVGFNSNFGFGHMNLWPAAFLARSLESA